MSIWPLPTSTAQRIVSIQRHFALSTFPMSSVSGKVIIVDALDAAFDDLFPGLFHGIDGPPEEHHATAFEANASIMGRGGPPAPGTVFLG